MNNIIFLDIDGVLQPIGSADRFNHDTNALTKKFAEELDPILETIHPLDIGAVYYDWHKPSVAYLCSLCSDCKASIVISSNWRYGQTFKQLVALFHIHELHEYVIDVTGDNDEGRAHEIKDFLDNHPSITKFVIFDDIPFPGMSTLFPQQFILCKNYITEQDFIKASNLLKNEQ